ncbi:unnamed protein product, partial [Mycena citricolor]
MIFDEKVGALIVSETHLSADQTEEIQDSHIGKRLSIYNSENRDDPSTKGIAIVLNREITNTQDVQVKHLIPGRAILATLHWHSDRTLTILGVYAPAESMQANENFWDSLSERWLTEDLPVPDLMGGDMNLVEEPLDRLPSREDAPRTVAALRRFKRLLGLVDGWRGENPDAKDFTYTSGRDTHSRIDRIYVSNAQLKRTRKWTLDDCVGKLSDHRMVSTTITAPGSPTIGKGRYTIPLFLLKDKKFMDFVQKTMIELEDRQADCPGLNVQAEWSSLKTAIRDYARSRAKEAIGASREKKKTLQTRKAQILKTTHGPDSLEQSEVPDTQTYTETEAAAEVHAIQGEIDKITDVQREQRRTETRARCFTELDHITKFTVAMSKDKTPRDTITLLRRTDTTPPREAKRSKDMAELARDYHHNLQQDPSEQNPATKDHAIESALEHTEARGDPEKIEELKKQLTAEDVILALKQAATGTASGVDGIPYELWRRLHQIHLEVTKQNAALGPDKQKRVTLADSTDSIDQAHIAKDGEAVRILGGYIGNKIEPFALWTPMLEKTDAARVQWEKLFPTIEARRHIDQIITGSMTQYLTMVNGMPAAVTKHLLQAQREFIWGGAKSSPVQRATLSQPTRQGGKNLLDLEARNDALTILKLQSFLDLDPTTRADWGYFADSRLEKASTRASKMDNESFDNMFLQTWTPNRKLLTTELREMLRIAKRYNLSFAPVQPTQTLLQQMPLFHHTGEDPTQTQRNNTPRCRCLRRNHGVSDILSAMPVAERLRNKDHRESTKCDCPQCKSDRESLGCRNPDACARAVPSRLAQLGIRWIPKDTGSLPQRATEGERDNRTKQLSLPPTASKTDGFRICVKSTPHPSSLPPFRQRSASNQETMFIATHKDPKSPRLGIAVWFGPEDPRNTNFLAPEELGHTRTTGENLAMLTGLKRIHRITNVKIIVEDDTYIQEISPKLSGWEDAGWINVPDKDILRPLTAEIRGRTGQTTFGMPGKHSAEETLLSQTTTAAKQAALANTPPLPRLLATTRPDLLSEGVKLATLTQRTAYATIRAQKETAVRPATRRNVEEVSREYTRGTQAGPTADQVWASIRSRDFSRQVRNFLWKAMHEAHRIGTFWKHIPDCTDRGTCTSCGVTEDLRHILLECQCAGQEQVWKLAEKLWSATGQPWVTPTFGGLLGEGLTRIKLRNGRVVKGLTRLHHIIISESIFTIWKLRNERVISNDGEEPSAPEIEGKWNRAIESRFALDRTLTNKNKFGGRALKPHLVETTWRKVVTDTSGDTLNDKWLENPRVL